MAGEKSVQEQSAVPKDSQKREEVTIKFGKGLVGTVYFKNRERAGGNQNPKQRRQRSSAMGILCGIAQNGS